jgi:hypothetical protein
VAQDDAEHAIDARYLHPVVRHYSRGRFTSEHHIAENLENEWNGPAHCEPLATFFAKCMTQPSTANPASGAYDASALTA